MPTPESRQWDRKAKVEAVAPKQPNSQGSTQQTWGGQMPTPECRQTDWQKAKLEAVAPKQPNSRDPQSKHGVAECQLRTRHVRKTAEGASATQSRLHRNDIRHDGVANHRPELVCLCLS